MHYRGFSQATAFLAAAGIAIALAAPASAQVKEGVDAWSQGDYAGAVRDWQGPAAKGDADAQFNLAQAYKLGRGVPQDLAKAEELYRLAAAQGHLQAADNYGLLLFQRGEHAKAMPYIKAAADRGDPRAQYVLGLALFNGDGMTKDPVRAYALVSLAQQAGLPQATRALAQMDQYIPLDQRRQSVTLAAKIAADAQATRARQVAAADLGVERPAPSGPAGAGADFTRGAPAAGAHVAAAGSPPMPRPVNPLARPPALAIDQTPAPAATRPAPPPPAKRTPEPPAHAPAAMAGPWRVQLGAFGVAGNAERLWDRVKGRPELAGARRMLVPAGSVTKLQAGGFASQDSAQAACDRLKAGEFDCIATNN